MLHYNQHREKTKKGGGFMFALLWGLGAMLAGFILFFWDPSDTGGIPAEQKELAKYIGHAVAFLVLMMGMAMVAIGMSFTHL